MVIRNIDWNRTTIGTFRLAAWLLLVCSCPNAPGEGRDATELLGMMTDSLDYPSIASMTLQVQSTASWNTGPETSDAPYVGTATDRWRVTSDSARLGRELRRDTSSESIWTRSVVQYGKQWIFHFDTGLPSEAAILGRVEIRPQSFRRSRGRMPITEYFDRVFVFSGRFAEEYTALKVDPAMATVDGHPCHVVRGAWNGREFEFWLDAEFGYLPRKYTMRLDHEREDNFGAGAGTRQFSQPLIVPPEVEEVVDSPSRSEESLQRVVLEQKEGRSYIAEAVLEKKRFYSDGSSYTHILNIKTPEFSLAPAPDSDEFLSFAGLLRDGTPVEETVGGRFEPVSVNYFVFKDGVMVPSSAPVSSYFRGLWSALKTLVTDFSLENLRRVDSMFLVAVCAFAALLANGIIAYLSYCRSKARPPEVPSIED